MALAKCTENDNNPPEYDLNLYSGLPGEQPSIFFMIPDECWPDSDYDGAGMMEVSLESLLSETVEKHLLYDQGKGTFKIVSLLREYADRLEKSANANAAKWTEDQGES